MGVMAESLAGRGFARAMAQSERPLVGTWVKVPALETVEMIADAGFDFIVIDQEHAPLTLEWAYRMTALAQALRLQVLVRVPDRSGSHLQRLLDCGVDGILVPRVSTVDEAKAAIGQMVFSPTGERGLGTTSRAGGWGSISRADYLGHGEAVMRAVQLEDMGVLEHAEEIAGLAGLNGIFLGAGDLGLSSGLPSTDPKITSLVDNLLAVATAAGVPVGTAVGNGDQAQAAVERGFGYVMVSNDASMFGAATKTVVEGVRSAFGWSAPASGGGVA